MLKNNILDQDVEAIKNKIYLYIDAYNKIDNISKEKYKEDYLYLNNLLNELEIYENMVFKNIFEEKNIKIKLGEYIKNNKELSLIINKTVISFIPLILIALICFNNEYYNQDDYNIAYLRNYQYESLIPYYNDNKIKNIEYSSLYIKYSEIYDLDLEIVIKTIDSIINNYKDYYQQKNYLKTIESNINSELKLIKRNTKL